jgi:ubiquitin-like 1-activating enzyme E1 A
MSINERCRSFSIPFYCAGTLGLNGWIFSDLGDVHEYVIEKPDLNAPIPASTSVAPQSAIKEQSGNAAQGDGVNGSQAITEAAPTTISTKRLEKRQQKFVPLRSALKTSWKGLTRAQQRRNRLSPGLFGVWSLWDYIEGQEGEEVASPKASKLLEIASQKIQERGIDVKAIFNSQGIDATTYFNALEISITQPGEFSPTCAILGGVLSQDVLNALGGREEPLVNWFQLEGLTGAYYK